MVYGFYKKPTCGRSSHPAALYALAFKPENVKFFPFFAKNHDVTPYKKCENRSKNKFSLK